MIETWPCPTPDGRTSTEYACGFLRGRQTCILIVPPLFDEANRMRRLLIETMRLLDAARIDCILPDLPGTNESPQNLDRMSLQGWYQSMISAATHFGATGVLAVRGGGLVAPALPGWLYAPTSGTAILRQMMRMRILAAREAGRDESSADLLEQGRATGLDLAGYPLPAEMVAGLQDAVPPTTLKAIHQSDIGGTSLWLRAEPDHDANQAEALARVIISSLGHDGRAP